MVIGIAALLAFYLAFNLGANDVANAMGTSVGAGSIRLRQALVLAGVLELAGVLFLGDRVSLGLLQGVVDLGALGDSSVQIRAMLAVLVAGGLWLNLATLLGVPVSSSHAIVGAIAGVGWLGAGAEAVQWESVGRIGLAWGVTPLLSGAIAAGLGWLVQRLILGTPEPRRAFGEWLPWLGLALVLSFGALVGSVVVTSLGVGLQRFGVAIGFAKLRRIAPRLLGLGLVGMGTLGVITLGLSRLRQMNGSQMHRDAGPDDAGPDDAGPDDAAHHPVLPDRSVEAGFGLLQVVSAGLVAFAHGANDVGNAIAPLAAIVQLLNHPQGLGSGVDLPGWVLLLGGVGIVGGLAVLGGPVIATVGQGLLALQPSRGFCAEWATALTVLLASRLGLPVSTSHALVGAVVGVGLVQGETVHWRTLGRIGLAWVTTVPGAMGLAIAIFWGLGYGMS